MDYQSHTLSQYIKELASGAPTPGGGSGAALIGATGAALVSMVGNLTIGRKKYAAVESDMRQIVEAAGKLQEELLALVTEDTEVYGVVMSAYKLPRSTDEEKAARQAAIEEGLRHACSVPLRTAEACIKILELAIPAAQKGNTNAVSDAAVGGHAAHAALLSALLNVRINLVNLPDDEWKAQTTARVEQLAAQGAKLAQEVQDITDRILGE